MTKANESTSPADNTITRQQFMDFFRSDEGYEALSADDGLELFGSALKGGSDITVELLQSLCGDYSVQDIEISRKRRFCSKENVHRHLGAAVRELQTASQALYDALQRYLMDFADSELPADLVAGMDELEAAWRTADGKNPKSDGIHDETFDCESLVDGALEAIGEILMKYFPKAKHGDLSPERTIRLVLAMEAAIREWISNNVDSQTDDEANS
jgi:hypothetical protein